MSERVPAAQGVGCAAGSRLRVMRGRDELTGFGRYCTRVSLTRATPPPFTAEWTFK